MVKLQTGDIDNFARDNLQGQIDHRDGVDIVDNSDSEAELEIKRSTLDELI